jgi:hypothetical protein
MLDVDMIDRAAQAMAKSESYGWVFERKGFQTQEQTLLAKLYRKRAAICFAAFRDCAVEQENAEAGNA